MTDTPTDALAEAPVELAPEGAALARSERRLGVTRELAEIGMDLARALRAEVMAQVSGVEGGAGEPAPRSVFGGDAALAYSRIARAVRMTLALEALIDGDVQVRVQRAASERFSNRRFEEMRKTEEKIAEEAQMIREAVRWAIETDTTTRGDRRETERLYRELEEVLEDEHDWEAIVGLPLNLAIEHICRELGVPFDADLWFDGDDEADPVDPGSEASEPVDRGDPPDGLDRALELANRGGEGAGPMGSGKPRPP